MADNQQQHKPTTPVSQSGKTRLQPPFNQHRPSLIGMVHVHATPGSPYANLDPASIAAKAADEAGLLANTGFDALIIENMHDRPYLHAEELGPETTALMTRVAIETRKALDKTNPNFPIGIQILSGGSQQAIAVAAIAGLDFIRCENFVFAEIADEGLFARAESAKLLRYRNSINAENVRIFADIKKKHASHAITADVSIEETAEAAQFFGADALIVTGSATAKPTDPAHVAAARDATPLPVLVGSGVTPQTLPQLFSHADALIVGSWYKHQGHWANDPDEARCRQLVEAAKNARSNSPHN